MDEVWMDEWMDGMMDGTIDRWMKTIERLNRA